MPRGWQGDVEGGSEWVSRKVPRVFRGGEGFRRGSRVGSEKGPEGVSRGVPR